MKYSLKVQIIKRENEKKIYPLRIRISYQGIRVDFRPGISIPEEVWDADKQRANLQTKRYKSEAAECNKRLNEISAKVEELFTRCELIEKRIPTTDELKSIVVRRFYSDSIFDVAEQYVKANPHLEPSTIAIYKSLLTYIKNEYGILPINQFTKDFLQDFLSQLTKTRKNSTAFSLYRKLKALLRFAFDNGIYTADGLQYKFKYKRLDKTIIYLTMDELIQFSQYEEPKCKSGYRVHDVYTLCCFTGLRISDAFLLKWENVYEDHIQIVTKKTATPIIIELNKFSKAILDRQDKKDSGPIFKTIPIDYFERHLRQICKKLNFDTPITNTYYRGSERISETQPKWRFITSHTARKTFVVNAITLGIPMEVVMKWTGHKTMSSFSRYMDIVEPVKKANMDKFNTI